MFYGLIKSYSRDLGTWLFSTRDSIFCFVLFRLILLGTLHCLYIFPYFKLQGACSHIVNRFSERSSILSIYLTANKWKKNRIALSTLVPSAVFTLLQTHTQTHCCKYLHLERFYVRPNIRQYSRLSIQLHPCQHLTYFFNNTVINRFSDKLNFLVCREVHYPVLIRSQSYNGFEPRQVQRHRCALASLWWVIDISLDWWLIIGQFLSGVLCDLQVSKVGRHLKYAQHVNLDCIEAGQCVVNTHFFLSALCRIACGRSLEVVACPKSPTLNGIIVWWLTRHETECDDGLL